MSKLIITNAFSLNMVSVPNGALIWKRLGLLEVAALLLANDFESAVGHQSTANVFSKEIGIHVACKRTTVEFREFSQLVVGQYKGPRLEEGATQLPDGAKIEWFLVMGIPVEGVVEEEDFKGGLEYTDFNLHDLYFAEEE